MSADFIRSVLYAVTPLLIRRASLSPGRVLGTALSVEESKLGKTV